MSQSRRSTGILKVGLSVFLAYHLAAIVILPMGTGLVIRELGHYFMDYANIFNLNTVWQFFSPGPSPIFYLEYTYSYPGAAPGEDDESTVDGETRFLPEKRTDFSISDFYSRRLYSMRYLSLDETRMEQFMAPWLCKQDPKAVSVTVRQTYGEIQAVERHRGDYGAESFADMADAKHTRPKTFSCVASGES